ncbi:MAG: hypothetical protein WD875_00885 [Pirellulales bacterium]
MQSIAFLAAVVSLAALSGIRSGHAETRIYFSEIENFGGDLHYALPGTHVVATILDGPVQGRPMFPAIFDDRLYWSTYYPGQLRRSDLDGFDTETLASQGDTTTRAVQFYDGHVYWANEPLGAIYRAELDGSDVETVLSGYGPNESSRIFDFEIYNGRFYWVSFNTRVVNTARLDGSDFRQIDVADGATRLFAIELANDRIYLSDNVTSSSGRIISTNLLGGDVRTLVTGPYATSIDVFGDRVYYNHDTGTYPISSVPITGGSPRLEYDGSQRSWQIAVVDVTPPDATAYSAFDEPNLNAGQYMPSPMSSELGFTTTSSPSGGQNPLAGVILNGPSRRVFSHRSVNASTSFDFVDVSQLDSVRLSIDIQPQCTGYERGDLLHVYVTNGTESIDVLRAAGTEFSGDAIELLDCEYMTRYLTAIPDEWTQLSLRITTSTNSSTGAERFDFDNVRISGTAVVPEPTTLELSIALFGSVVSCVWLRLRRTL